MWYTPISKNVVGEIDECQLSNGDCTTEKKCGYWILIANNLPWCRLHSVSTDLRWRVIWFVHILQNSVAEASFFLGVKGQWERYISKFLVNDQFSATRRTHCFCIPNMEITVSFGRAISVRQQPFAALSENIFWNRHIQKANTQLVLPHSRTPTLAISLVLLRNIRVQWSLIYLFA